MTKKIFEKILALLAEMPEVSPAETLGALKAVAEIIAADNSIAARVARIHRGDADRSDEHTSFYLLKGGDPPLYRPAPKGAALTEAALESDLELKARVEAAKKAFLEKKFPWDARRVYPPDTSSIR